jgi:hypothetical protein
VRIPGYRSPDARPAEPPEPEPKRVRTNRWTWENNSLRDDLLIAMVPLGIFALLVWLMTMARP